MERSKVNLIADTAVGIIAFLVIASGLFLLFLSVMPKSVQIFLLQKENWTPLHVTLGLVFTLLLAAHLYLRSDQIKAIIQRFKK